MTGRRTIIGLCILCALLVSAVAAQSSSALGTTSLTCVKTSFEFAELHGEHCLKEGPPAAIEYKDVKWTGETTGVISNEKTKNGTTEAEKAVLKTVVGANSVTLTATGIFSEGKVKNSEEGSEMIVTGESPTGIHFTNVTVSEPAGCTVKQGGVEGTVTTKPIKVTTKGQGDSLKFEPKESTLLAEFEIVGAGCPEFLKERNPIKVFGSIKATTNGATLLFKHEETTTAGTLRMFSAAGPKAGIEGAATMKAHEKDGEETKPLVYTTNSE